MQDGDETATTPPRPRHHRRGSAGALAAGVLHRLGLPASPQAKRPLSRPPLDARGATALAAVPSSGPAMRDYRSGALVALDSADLEEDDILSLGSSPPETPRKAGGGGASRGYSEIVPVDITTGMQPAALSQLAFGLLAVATATAASHGPVAKLRDANCGEGGEGSAGGAAERGGVPGMREEVAQAREALMQGLEISSDEGAEYAKLAEEVVGTAAAAQE
eukprot:jgi/Tetstr1/459888/TSEL_005230.t1